MCSDQKCTLKKEEATGKKCRERREKSFASFKEKVSGIQCYENSKIKICLEFKVVNHWKGGKIHLKMHLIEEKSCYLLLQLRKNTQNENTVGDRKCKKVPLSHFKRRHFIF